MLINCLAFSDTFVFLLFGFAPVWDRFEDFCDSCFPRLALVAVFEWELLTLLMHLVLSSFFLRKVPTDFPIVLTSTVVILGNLITREYELLSLLDFTEAQLNILCSSGRHHSLAYRPCLQRCFQLNFLLFWR